MASVSSPLDPGFFSGLTVIIPARDRCDAIMTAVESVAAQSVRPGRLILVDNGSADVTLERMHGLAAGLAEPGFDIDVVSEPVAGACAARNRGLSMVTSEWTMFFDSDDEMMPGHIAAAMECALREPDADIVGWPVLHVLSRNGSPDPGRWTASVRPFEVSDIAFHNVFHSSLATQRYMARTSLFRRAGGWDNAVPIWNDIELGVRLLALNPRAVLCPGESHVIVNAGADSITGGSYSSRAGRYDSALRSMRACLPPPFRHWIDFKEMILAACLRREGSVAESRAMRRGVLERASRHRLLLRLCYLYTRLGGRGAARLLKPFIA